MNSTLRCLVGALVLFLASDLDFPARVSALPPPPAAAAETADPGWPRQFSRDGIELTIYQPQLDFWDGRQLRSRAAVSIRLPGSNQSTFGVIWISARTNVDKENRLVDLDEIEIAKASFPSAPASEAAYLEMFRQEVPRRSKAIALDRLEASLAILEERRKGSALPLRNDPPRIRFSKEPALLITIDGPPVYRTVQGTSLERVLNTRPLLLRDSASLHYLHVFDGWMSSPSLDGPWAVAANPPAELGRALEVLERTQAPVDLLRGELPRTDDAVSSSGAPPSEPARPTLSKGPIPAIFVATSPTELLVTEGEPSWAPIDGAQLLYARNTTGNIFKDLTDQKLYILISGRWYRAASENGPWQYVSGKQLPVGFSQIPDESPKENVKASVPGTPQAAEALIASEIPQTARVDKRATIATLPEYDGEPKLAPIRGTNLQYVLNGSSPVLLVDRRWYTVENGIWFVADSAWGPWSVAESVPPSVYSIPPDCPLHFLTYVRIYDASDENVSVGYTPGYTGTYVDDDGLVVYGTGYDYEPWVDSVWYGPPVTWGLAFGLTWTPWWGWGYDIGFGWGWGPGWVWGCLPPPWWGPIGWGWGYNEWHWHGGGLPPRAVPWRAGGWPSAGGSIYRRWGRTVTVSPRPVPAPAPALNVRHPVGIYGRSYNSRTGEIAAGQRGVVRRIYPPTLAPRGTPSRPSNNVFAGPDGNVYRRDDKGNWQRVAPRDARPPAPDKVRPLERERGAREVGDRRSSAARPPSPPPPPRNPPRVAPPRGGTSHHR